MLIPGVVSVTFRKLGVWGISELSQKCGLKSIEWGGDVHVPPADTNAIDLARDSALSHSLKIASYGSYHKCNGDDGEIEKVLSTASLLGAPNIRIWAGTLWSNDYSAETRKAAVDNIVKVCRRAKAYNLTVSPEFHQATLTDELWSALQLVDEVAEDNFRLYWQPNQFKDDEYNLSAIKGVLPYLSNVHVFSWKEDDKYPLEQGEYMWKKYLDVIRSDGKDHNLLLEFVCDGTVPQFEKDSETLLKWIE